MGKRPDIDLDAVARAAQEGELTANQVRLTREDLRWSSKPGDDEREGAIAAALGQIDDAMRPIRHYLGRLSWDPIPESSERPLRESSGRLQYERKQLKKMRRHRG